MSASSSEQSAFEGMPTPLYRASPSRLLAYLDCPRRYRMQYLDRPRPTPRPQMAHTSLGIAVHNALRDWWDLDPQQADAMAAAVLVRSSWIPVGYRDDEQSLRWREEAAREVWRYVRGLSPLNRPVGIERTVSFRTDDAVFTGRVDRLDERPLPDGGSQLVVVDYKTSRRPVTEEDLRTSLPMAIYAAAVARMMRRGIPRVELHHVPTGQVVGYQHTPESLERKLAEASSLVADCRRADASYAEVGVESPRFAPSTGPLCGWCDYRDHCAEGQRAAPAKQPWAALEPDDAPPGHERDLE